MKIPPATESAVRMFERHVPRVSLVVVRKLFGQPSAFLAGNMFFGVFGDQLVLRLDPVDREEIRRVEGAKTFEPMPGHPMSEYVTLPPSVVAERERLTEWIRRSLAYVATLPAKAAKSRARPAKPRTRPSGR